MHQREVGQERAHIMDIKKWKTYEAYGSGTSCLSILVWMFCSCGHITVDIKERLAMQVAADVLEA
jgi:hypothetical protein